MFFVKGICVIIEINIDLFVLIQDTNDKLYEFVNNIQEI